MTKEAILENEVKRITGGDIVIDIYFVTLKIFSITVTTELGAYKIAYAYRHGAVKVSQAPNLGGWYVMIGDPEKD